MSKFSDMIALIASVGMPQEPEPVEQEPVEQDDVEDEDGWDEDEGMPAWEHNYLDSDAVLDD